MILLATKTENQALALPIVDALNDLKLNYNIYCKEDNTDIEKFSYIINLYCNLLPVPNIKYPNIINFISDDHKIKNIKTLEMAYFNVFTSEACFKDAIVNGLSIDYSRDIIIAEDYKRFLDLILNRSEAA